MNSRSFFLAHAQDIVGIVAILFFSRSCFRPEVSLSIIVKCNVNRGAKLHKVSLHFWVFQLKVQPRNLKIVKNMA